MKPTTSREDYDAFCAMRNDINEMFGDMISQEATLKDGPTMAAECAAVVECLAKAKERMEASPFQPIADLPYDTTVLVLWSDGCIRQDFWYDQSRDEWLAERKRKPFHDDDPMVVPIYWMYEPKHPV